MSDTATTTGCTGAEWIQVIPIIIESIAWTVVLACFVALLIVQTMRKRRRSSPMIFIFSAMFALASLQYGIDLFWFFIQAGYYIQGDILLRDEGKVTPAEKGVHLNAQSVRGVLAVGTGLWLVSILLGDLVVFWRAWELSSHNLAAKRMLLFPGAVLLSYTGTIPVVLVCQSQGIPTREPYFGGICGKKALVNWCLSLLSNLLSTCVIAYIGWGHRTEMRKLFHSTRRRSVGERILGLLAESGFIYFSVNLIFVITITWSDTYSAGDVVASVFVQITPFVEVFVPMATHVIVLIYGSLWDTMSEHSGLSTRNHVTTSIRFATVSRISSGASLESPEIVPHGIEDVSKET